MSLTFLLIKPDVVRSGRADDLVKIVEASGFEVLARKQKTLSRADEMFLCPMHLDKDFFNDLVAFMTSGPSELFILRGENATEALNRLVGVTDPKKNGKDTLRGKFGTSIMRNAAHSPNSEENAVRELLYFFKVTAINMGWTDVWSHKSERVWRPTCLIKSQPRNWLVFVFERS